MRLNETCEDSFSTYLMIFVGIIGKIFALISFFKFQ